MRALLVVDAQNEFSERGERPVERHATALARILQLAQEFRAHHLPIAWVRHHNKPNESKAFVPGSWGAELSPGLGPEGHETLECIFNKSEFGAFTGTDLEAWLREHKVAEVVLAGFYTHMCVSTSAREALVRGFRATVDAEATGACTLRHALGTQTADEVRRTALMHLAHMGAEIVS